MTIALEQLIPRAAAQIRARRRIVALTGAGVSTESGIPTFRDALGGLWARYDPTRLATPQAFRQNPKLVWDFYEYRRELMRPARPNAGHYALAELEQLCPEMRLITQNVDDLHEQAGSRSVIRLHGRINANKCSAACRGEPTPVDITTLAWEHKAGPPPCPHCGAPVRPDVVWFGEALPARALEEAFAASERAQLMLVVGTSGVVRPAADLPSIAKSAGAFVIEINPVESEITPLADLWLAGSSAAVLPSLIAALRDDA